MSSLPRPDLPPGPHRDLVTALHDLHHRAGWPSLRTLARETGVSHTTVSKAFSSTSLPSWGTLELLVEAMGGSAVEFHERWLVASTPTDASARPVPRIAGRKAELDAVRRHLETGTGLLLVTGEAGIGKTKLVTTVAATTDTFVATGQCLPLSTVIPLLPVSDCLRSLHGSDDGTWLRTALARCAPYVQASLAALLPELALADAAPSRTDDRSLLFTACAAVLRALAEDRPVALLLGTSTGPTRPPSTSSST
jgi:transcriptional regulator with XRE-family HTH domain